MKYRREIDGLRALAVLPVILFHAGFTAFSGGFVGVDIFFVISGYLITTIIVAEMEQGSFSLLKFYERRARRILPALFFVMLCALPFAWFWMLPQDLRRFSASLVAVPVFASNVLFYLTSGYFDTASELKPLLHTWSLAVEEQYYVLFPLFLMLTWKSGKRWIIALLSVVAVVSVVAAQWGSTTQQAFTFYLLPTRGFEILIGALISLCISYKSDLASVNRSVSQSVSILGLTMILYAIFAFDKRTPSPSLYTLMPTIGAGLILVFANDKTLVGRLLGSTAFVGIGLISYSSYLWHQPLFAFAKLRTLDDLTTQSLVLLSLMSLALGYISWRYVENPFRDRKLTKTKTIVSWGSMMTILFLMIGLVGYLKKGFVSRVPERIRYLVENPQEPFANDLCLEKYPQLKKFDACLLSKDYPPEVLILGDSHSQHYYKSLSSALGKKSVMNLASWSCLPFSSDNHTSKNNCEANIDAAIRFVVEANSIKVVYLAGHWSYLSSGGFGIENQNYRLPGPLTKGQAESYIRAGAKVLDALTKSGKQILFIKDIPDLDFGVQSCFDMSPYKNNSIRKNCHMAFSSYLNRYKEYDLLISTLTNRYPSMDIYSPTSLFCSSSADACYATENNRPLYFDSDHLTLRGSDLVVQDILSRYPVN